MWLIAYLWFKLNFQLIRELNIITKGGTIAKTTKDSDLLHVTMATLCASINCSCLIQLQAITQQMPICQSTNFTMVTIACLIKIQLSISSGHHRNQRRFEPFYTHSVKEGGEVCLELSQCPGLFCAAGEQTCFRHIGHKVHLPSQSWKGTRPPCQPPCPTTSPYVRHPGHGWHLPLWRPAPAPPWSHGPREPQHTQCGQSLSTEKHK